MLVELLLKRPQRAMGPQAVMRIAAKGMVLAPRLEKILVAAQARAGLQLEWWKAIR